MSTTHGQPGLSSDQRSTIRSTVLSTRHTLEDELRRQLEKYGIYEDKRLPLEDLSHLSAEERHTRRTLDAAIERELESTEGDLERSITNYVREATKTYLNRFVALKTIEVRGLVEETITERPEYGNRSYMHHTVAEIAGELTDAPDDGFGAALDLAYQEIGAEIRMIFEESEHTAIDLDEQVREEILDGLDAIDDEAWESDEALGWVYQYFGEEEREEIDERVDEENYKIAGTDIATKTQLFTPRYIVEWMVDNSLGRLWLEMQGERTSIEDEEHCFYLAPQKDSLIDREGKPVKDITVFDPACGSGHMLFYAFDVLHQMYLEEGEVPKKYIPREILRNNLYGIDIDSGATQIAALSLYLKAKERSPEVEIPQINITSADAVLINGDRKQDVLQKARSDLEEEILEQIWERFGNIREFGSLIRIEDHVEDILESHKESIQATGQVEFAKDGSFSTQSSFVSAEGESESWDQVKNRLLAEIRGLASEALQQNNPTEEMFAGEVEKTVRLLDLFLDDYDVVITNPPYLNSRKMDGSIKDFIKDNYVGSRDTYTAFIERCGEFTTSDGYSSMVTLQGFMFMYSFRKLRKELLEEFEFIEFTHSTTMKIGSDETVMHVMRNNSERANKSSRFNRLVEEEDKITSLNQITKDNRSGKAPDNVYHIDQKAFTEIGRTPYIYWFGEEVLQLFVDYGNLNDIAEVKQGLGTGDDDRFTRCWWEVKKDDIGDKYSWLVMSGDDTKYYYSTDKVVLWENDGKEIKEFDGSRPQNTEYYQSLGVTYRDFSKHFTARHHPESDIFNLATRFVYADESEQLTNKLLAYLCSSPVRFVMKGLGSGLHFNVGDGKRLPVKSEVVDSKQVPILAEKGVDIQKSRYELSETNREFNPQKLLNTWLDISKEDHLKCDIEIIHGIIDGFIFEEYDISSKTRGRIYDNLPKNLAEYPHITNIGRIDTSEHEFRAEVPTKHLPEDEYEDLIEEISEHKDKGLREISETLKISPYTVAMARHEYDLYTNDEREEIAGRILSYYLGCAMGRWELDNVESTEILAFGDSYGDNVAKKMRECIKTTSRKENPDERESELQELLGQNIIDWIRNKFFRYYHTDEYKRRGETNPIYWQLQSSDGAFSCFLYYHEIDQNTLPKLRGQYLDPRIDELENELETLNAQTSGDNPNKGLIERKEKVQNDLEDIRKFRETIDEMIDDGVTADVEKGIWENIKEWDRYEVLETGLPKLKSSYSR